MLSSGSNPISIPVNGGWLDELRLHPTGALMTTYTYQPLIGITSVTDHNHHTVYFSYDAFGRLEQEQEQDKHITRQYQYHYINR